MQHPDQKYIDALASHDSQLINEIYSKFFETIKQMVLRNNGNKEDAENVFQSALMSIYEKVMAQPFELTYPFIALFYTICRNKWMNELRKSRNYKVTFIENEIYSNLVEDSFKIAEDFILFEERRKLIFETLGQLSESCQQLLLLSWEGKLMEEVAHTLRLTHGFARKKKTGCKGKLIELIMKSPNFQSLKW